jgi:hypothetical protein
MIVFHAHIIFSSDGRYTTPLIDKYRIDEYSDAGEQDMERQLYWVDSVLVASNDRWTFVIGRHPVYADTEKPEDERTDM